MTTAAAYRPSSSALKPGKGLLPSAAVSLGGLSFCSKSRQALGQCLADHDRGNVITPRRRVTGETQRLLYRYVHVCTCLHGNVLPDYGRTHQETCGCTNRNVHAK